MKVTVIKANYLTRELTEMWSSLQGGDPTLSSPYFHPEFTKAVASVRRDVRIGVLRDDSGVVGFFPYQRNWLGVGKPVGGLLSDFHGVILKPGVCLDVVELMRQCGLKIWDFDHLPAAQGAFHPFQSEAAPSYLIDLSKGYEHYCIERRRAGSEQIKKVYALQRKMEREIGSLHFVAGTRDRKVLRTLVAWKRAQYRRTGFRDIFAFVWVNGLLETLLRTQSWEFGGMLSALYVNDQIVAAHFGMRCGPVWHYWLPSYNPKFAKYSPGLILLLKIAEHGASLGVKRIDLGKGEEPYKQRLRSDSLTLLKGSIECPSPALAARWVFQGLKGMIEGTILDWPLRMSLRRLRRIKAGLLRE